MKGLLTEVPHTDEPIVGEVLPYPAEVFFTYEQGWDDQPHSLTLDLYADHARLATEDGDYGYTVVCLKPEQAKALFNALGVALYGN